MRTLVLAFPRMTSMQLWPLPLRQPWFEEGRDEISSAFTGQFASTMTIYVRLRN